MIIIKRNDTLPAMTSTIESPPGTPMVLAGASAKFLMRPRYGSVLKVNANATVVDALAGKLKYQWVAGDTDTVGVYQAEWQITFGDGTVMTVPTEDYLYIQIVSDLG